MIIRWVGRLLVVVGCLLTLSGAAYLGIVQHIIAQEGASHSTNRALVLKDGRSILLRQPTPLSRPKPPALILVAPTASSVVGATMVGTIAIADSPVLSNPVAATPVVSTPVAMATPETKVTAVTTKTASANPLVPNAHASEPQVLPPVRLYIPSISTDWPVVLSNGKQLPRFKGVGWLLGSAYPGAPGNMVLFGHLDGAYATLARLKELKPGDIFSVFTDGGEYRYSVRSSFETTPDDVEVMAPTDGATATLITCSGNWDGRDNMYDHRLVITADYLTESRR